MKAIYSMIKAILYSLVETYILCRPSLPVCAIDYRLVTDKSIGLADSQRFSNSRSLDAFNDTLKQSETLQHLDKYLIRSL